MIQVVDASVVVAALLDSSPVGRWSAARLGETDLAAPHLLPFEVANVVRRTVIRGVIEPAEGAAALHDLDRLQVELVSYAAVSRRAWELRDNLTVYDATYVAAAELIGCPLLTLDARIAAAPGLRCSVVVG